MTRSPHARRFSVLTGTLFAFGALVMVVAAFIVVENTSEDTKLIDLTWSQFRPLEDGPDAGSREISDYVGRQYRLGNGEQLVAVTGGPMELQGLPINIALRAPLADGGDIDLLPGTGVLYRMCGLGPTCSIEKGKASTARHLLLRRQALELALYSFKYLKDVDNAVVFLPPPPGRQADQALWFSKDELRAELSRPLQLTLPPPAPTPSNIRSAKRSDEIDRLTQKNLYSFTLTQANQESSVFLVFDALRTEPAIQPGSQRRGSGTGGNAPRSGGAPQTNGATPPGSGSNGQGGSRGGARTPGAGSRVAPPAGGLVDPLSPAEPG